MEGLCPEAMQWHFWLSLHENLHYDPDTGKWRWLERCGKSNGRVRNNGEAGTLRRDGRYQIRINGKFYLSSRLAWLYITGEWPTEIDHIDRNPSNDRWINLREVTRSENLKNRAPYRMSWNR